VPRPSKSALISISGAALLLFAALLVGTEAERGPSRNQAYLDAISASVSALPYRIGKWIGADIEPQAPAIELLKPNSLLQRRYISTDGTESFTILFVHCGDARDMQGHYPPVCYPANGWVLASASATRFVLGRDHAPSTIYRFRSVRNGSEQRMTILNFFAVPSEAEPMAADMIAVNRAAGGSARAALGAAQAQLIVTGSVSDEHMITLMEEIAPALEPIVSKVIHASPPDGK
jgi:hypothetical protein